MPMTMRNLIDSAYSVTHSNLSPLPIGASEWRQDRIMAELARFVALPKGGRAEEYFDHYLGGSGTPKYFRGADLARANAGVRKRLVDAIYPTLSTLIPGSTGLVGLRQRDVTEPDWWAAIGSFPLIWTYYGSMTTADGKIQVKLMLEGSNEYKWHPDDANRVSQSLHKSMDRLRTPKTNLLDILQPTQPARNFWMHAMPSEYTLVIDPTDISATR